MNETPHEKFVQRRAEFAARLARERVRDAAPALLAALEGLVRHSSRTLGCMPLVPLGLSCIFCGKATEYAAEIKRQAGDLISERIEYAAAIEHQPTCPILAARDAIAAAKRGAK